MENQTPVYLLALLLVEDMDSFQSDYVGPLKEINERHGVEAVVATPRLAAIEGELSENLAAVLRFPSQAALDAWYADPDYQPLIAARRDTTSPSLSRLIALTPMT
ncbi:MAG: DUF1330 domain-containing protein [Pseudomonadota bacterium]